MQIFLKLFNITHTIECDGSWTFREVLSQFALKLRERNGLLWVHVCRLRFVRFYDLDKTLGQMNVTRDYTLHVKSNDRCAVLGSLVSVLESGETVDVLQYQFAKPLLSLGCSVCQQVPILCQFPESVSLLKTVCVDEPMRQKFIFVNLMLPMSTLSELAGEVLDCSESAVIVERLNFEEEDERMSISDCLVGVQKIPIVRVRIGSLVPFATWFPKQGGCTHCYFSYALREKGGEFGFKEVGENVDDGATQDPTHPKNSCLRRAAEVLYKFIVPLRRSYHDHHDLNYQDIERDLRDDLDQSENREAEVKLALLREILSKDAAAFTRIEFLMGQLAFRLDELAMFLTEVVQGIRGMREKAAVFILFSQRRTTSGATTMEEITLLYDKLVADAATLSDQFVLWATELCQEYGKLSEPRCGFGIMFSVLALMSKLKQLQDHLWKPCVGMLLCVVSETRKKFDSLESEELLSLKSNSIPLRANPGT